MPSSTRPDIILGLMAAGLSERFENGNKLLQILNGQAIVNHCVESLQKLQAPLFVVIGHEKESIKKRTTGLDLSFLENPNFKKGLGSSLQVMIEHMLQAFPNTPLLVHLGDLPKVKGGDLENLWMQFSKNPQRIHMSQFGQKNVGPPFILPSHFFGEFLQNLSPRGAKSWMLK
ncbi:MAG: NTP transferase domain-containing protein, partial [Pseudomonadota bacterium]